MELPVDVLRASLASKQWNLVSRRHDIWTTLCKDYNILVPAVRPIAPRQTATPTPTEHPAHEAFTAFLRDKLVTESSKFTFIDSLLASMSNDVPWKVLLVCYNANLANLMIDYLVDYFPLLPLSCFDAEVRPMHQCNITPSTLLLGSKWI